MADSKQLRRAVAVIPISFTAGNDILACCMEALRLARLLDVSVEFTLNGVSMFATQSMTPELLEKHYEIEVCTATASFARTADSLGTIPDGEKSANK